MKGEMRNIVKSKRSLAAAGDLDNVMITLLLLSQ